MYYTLKVKPIGNSLGAVFPEELLQRLNIQEGDKIYLTELLLLLSTFFYV